MEEERQSTQGGFFIFYHKDKYFIEDLISSIRDNPFINVIRNIENKSVTFEGYGGCHITLQTINSLKKSNPIQFIIDTDTPCVKANPYKFIIPNFDNDFVNIVNYMISYPVEYDTSIKEKSFLQYQNIDYIKSLIPVEFGRYCCIDDNKNDYTFLNLDSDKGVDTIMNFSEVKEDNEKRYCIKESGYFEFDFCNQNDIIEGLHEISKNIEYIPTVLNGVIATLELDGVYVILETINAERYRNDLRANNLKKCIPNRKNATNSDYIHVMLCVAEEDSISDYKINETLLKISDIVSDTYGSIIYHQSLLSSKAKYYL